MGIKKNLFLHLFISFAIIFIVLFSTFTVCGEQISRPSFAVQSNNYVSKGNAFQLHYDQHTTEKWLQNAIAGCKKNAPAYFKQYWNWLWWIKNSTNCYAYAFDLKKNPITNEYFEKNIGFQPGSLSGQQVFDTIYDGVPESNKQLVEVVSNDMTELGYVFIEARPGVTIPDKAYLVALAVFPGNEEYISDYHWYRLNPDGTWSHKPGFNNVTNVDESGKIITDPLTANRGLYDCFVGYFYVVKKEKIN